MEQKRNVSDVVFVEKLRIISIVRCVAKIF